MKTRMRVGAMLLVLLVMVFFTGTSVASTDVKVMTYNVDEGTDFGAIIGVLTGSTTTDFQTAVTQTINEVLSSNPQLRAQLIATEIAAAKPDLVGLQEAAVWTFPVNDQIVHIDLLQMILDNLAGLGQNYTAEVTVPEFQINTFGVSFLDQDVILARSDGALQITDRQQKPYSHLVPLPAFPPYLPAPTAITRGWAYVDVTLNGTAFRFITTHLEDGTNSISPIFAVVQALQEIELVGVPASTALPVIIAGDFNTIANNPFSPTFLIYLYMLNNGFTDAWTRVHHPFLGRSGATCCQDDLTVKRSELTQRLDLVFARGNVGVDGAQLVGNHIDNIGVQYSWPSDHAAVESELQVGP